MPTEDEDEDVDSGWGAEEEPQGGAAPVAKPPPLAKRASAAKIAAVKAAEAKVVTPQKPSTTAPAPTEPDPKPATTAKTETTKPVGSATKPTTPDVAATTASKPSPGKPSASTTSPATPAAKSASPATASATASPAPASPTTSAVAPTLKPLVSKGLTAQGTAPKTGSATASVDPLKPAKATSLTPTKSPVVTVKPASKAPPPKLAVGPRPDAKLGVPPPPRSPMMGASLRSTDPAKSLEAAVKPSEPPISLDIGNLGESSANESFDAASLNIPLPAPSDPGGAQPLSQQPKSRSFTPRVSNAVQQAKELDVRAAADPNQPTPQGTSVVAAAIAASGLRTSDRLHERPTPLRMPSVSSRDVSGEAPRPAADLKPATTSLRFQEQPKPKQPPRDRKQTLKLTVATQNFALELFSRDTEGAAPAPKPKTRVSSPMLDLHLPDDLTTPDPPKKPAKADAHDDSPEIEVSDEGQFSDSFDDLPIDEVLEAVRQSSMPPAPGSEDLSLDGIRDSLAPKGRGPLASSPLISDIPLEGPGPGPISDEAPPVSDLPPTVRGDPPDALRFGPSSDGTPVVENDPRLTPIRERFDRGDYAGALLRAESLLEEDPAHEGAKLLVRNCQERVKDMYISRLGSCDAVLRVVMSRERIQDLAFDHRGGFLISLIDGVATVDDVLDISGMPQLEALRLLFELKQEGVIDSNDPNSSKA